MDDIKTPTSLIFEDFDITKVCVDEPCESVPVTFWLPVEYKAKYDQIQERSNRKFGKHLKEVLKKSIERVKLEDEVA